MQYEIRGTALASVLFFAIGGCASDGNGLGTSMQSVLDTLGGITLGQDGVLTKSEIGRGLKEALKIGTDRVVDTLGAADGFYASRDVHIALPGVLADVDRALGRIGMNQLTQDLEVRLNRAAETAVPRAKAIFRDSIAGMRLDDIMNIYNGPNDAATQYFRGKMSGPLARAFHPIVDDELSRVGAIRAYDRAVAQYRQIPGVPPGVPDMKSDLIAHVLDRSIDAMFLYLGREEARIREDPVARTTELLRRVFGRR